ncbi:phenoloxidase 2-like isoform X2 [Neocloeon triangulifer]|uniref:phenoloxidase 2-like isoform X2 n=1 Tax=Neocloeon triangulifer TaxID=2078957 RepID=UPI00286F428A|nr:phenoloxidase 2-like isoform X2 [Neocloeon triangulifer]
MWPNITWVFIATFMFATSLQTTNAKMTIENRNKLIHAMTTELFEPAFLPKGPDRLVVKISKNANHCYEDLRAIERLQAATINDLSNIIYLSDIRAIPNLDFLKELPRDELFSIFMPHHQRLASKLINLLMEVGDVDEMLQRAYCIRDKTNPGLFVYALSFVLVHRPDCRSLKMRSLAHIFPGNFIKSSELEVAQHQMTIDIINQKDETVVEQPFDFSGNDLDPEHWLSYFREDVFMNLHHWHWHIWYPFIDPKNASNIPVVDKDRRGELFYYMHQQVIARYNFERLSNRLPFVEPFDDLKNPIADGYYSKLNQGLGSKPWAGRPKNLQFQNLNRYEFKISVQDLLRWKNRILDAIIQGKVRKADNTEIELNANTGINILGNMVESSVLSVNKKFYGDLHNMMHVFTALSHDPDGRFNEDMGVMGETSTAMRDPAFYKVHAMVDNIFNSFKETLPPYTVPELNFPAVEVTSISLQSDQSDVLNKLETHWEKFTISLNRSLDFLGEPNGNHIVSIKTDRLQHVPFQYNIKAVLSPPKGENP